jgi:hypothetical protein
MSDTSLEPLQPTPNRKRIPVSSFPGKDGPERSPFQSSAPREKGGSYFLYVVMSVIVLPLLTGAILSAMGLFAQVLPMVLGVITLGGLLTLFLFAGRDFFRSYKALSPKGQSSLHLRILRRSILTLSLLLALVGLTLLASRAWINGGIFVLLAAVGGFLRSRLK